ncbi:MAG: DinB family protein [Cyclobacteriaceae bacterium]|jgi:uncharacterized damage-inducible protein DinB|nr:DinB family protein [Cyclobacteriaceae bacterium]
MLERPGQEEYNEFYQGYINRVKSKDVIEFLKVQRRTLSKLLNSISEDRISYRYAEGKWSVKQVLRHIIDTEIVFAYSVHAISKNNSIELPGMDEQEYMDNTDDNGNSFEQLVEEFNNVRKATISMIESMHPSSFLKIGKASGFSISVRAKIFILAGHAEHHKFVLKEKYLG